jgi:hypothetical protein
MASPTLELFCSGSDSSHCLGLSVQTLDP